MTVKFALIYAETVCVCCPYCEAEQPSFKEGSLFWELQEVEKILGSEISCCSCDKTFRIMSVSNIKWH